MGTFNPRGSFLQWSWVVGHCGSQRPALESHRALAGCWNSDRAASRSQKTELSHATLGALSKSVTEGVEPHFFKPDLPPLRRPPLCSTAQVGGGVFLLEGSRVFLLISLCNTWRELQPHHAPSLLLLLRSSSDLRTAFRGSFPEPRRRWFSTSACGNGSSGWEMSMSS